MPGLLAAIVGYAVILALGDSLARLFPRDDREQDPCERLAYAFPLGAGAASLLIFWGSLAFPGHVGASFVLVPTLALVALGSRPGDWVTWARGLGARARSHALSLDRVSLAVAVVLGFEILASASLSFATDLDGDGIAIYALKARAAFASGGMPLSYFTDFSRRWSHLDYPLLLPLDEAFFFFLRGDSSLVLAKALAPGFLASLLLLVYAGVRRERSRPVALLAAGLLGMLPRLVLQAAHAEADVPIALLWFGSVLHLRRYLVREDRRDLLLATVFVALAAWTKREGLVYLGFQATTLAIVPFARRTPIREAARTWLPFLGIVLVMIGPWLALTRVLDVPGNDFFPITVETTKHLVHRFPKIAGITVRELLWYEPTSPWPDSCLERWGILWHLFFLACACTAITRRELLPRLYVALSVVVPIGLLAFAYVYSAWGPVQLGWQGHVKFSEFRLILQETPSAMYLVALVLGEKLDRRG